MHDSKQNGCLWRQVQAIIFTEKYNIRFKSPKMDMCQLCGSLDVAIRHAENCKNETEVHLLRVKKELRHRKVETGQSTIREAIELERQNRTVHVITFDLQQTLRAPKSTTGPTFYKHGCAGQNKNWTLVAFWLYLLKSSRFQHIEHTFPQVGHSTLSNDRDFAQVEKNVTSHYQMVYRPDHWQEFLKTVQRKKPFKLFHQPQASANQSKFSIRNCVQLVFSTVSQQPFSTMMFCDTYSGSLELVALSKRGRSASSSSFLNELKTKYPGPLPIKAGKLRYIISSSKLIPAVYRDWYNSLLAASNSTVSQGDEEEEESSV
ncbi:hypothetical protein PR048_004710 [Dryococelus australis]|uniref:Uncharacterized protein n=1 Tax=Dryococelus australis TaxID=614101 RepID=A0ABQ9I671_9NEOP|nr:hypothetical protein PR048_004710 [Dryococelus australis]